MELLNTIYLIDRSFELVEAWKTEFSKYSIVKPIQGDYFSTKADAMVSPANSFGIMDGGLDDAIRDQLGDSVEKKVQAKIIEIFYGEMPVGSSVMVNTEHPSWPYLIAAPTMRVPEDVSHTINAYIAFRSVLNIVRIHNSQNHDSRIESIVCSGFGTGIGGLHSRKCALQMRVAFESMKEPGLIPSVGEIHTSHRTLMDV